MAEESPSLKHNHELLDALLAKAGNPPRYPAVSKQAECLPLDTSKLPPFSYNPSILRIKDNSLRMTYRYHFATDFRTRLGIAEISDGKIVGNVDLPLAGQSLEDARLFWFLGVSWMSWVEATSPTTKGQNSVVKYAPLSNLETAFQPVGGGNNGTSVQKNWCFFESQTRLFCVFWSYPEQVIFEISGDQVVNEYKTPGVRWPYGEIHGGTILPYNGKLLRVFHSALARGIGKYEFRYFVGACLMNPEPPFKTVAVSTKPILYGSEDDSLTPDQRKACFHWRTWQKSVVFPGGMIPDGDGFILAVGINDAACALVRIKPEQLNL